MLLIVRKLKIFSNCSSHFFQSMLPSSFRGLIENKVRRFFLFNWYLNQLCSFLVPNEGLVWLGGKVGGPALKNLGVSFEL